MIVTLGVDHHAVELKKSVIAHLEMMGFEVIDRGTMDTAAVDYPDIARKIAKDIRTMKANFGILICQTGVGMSIAANKFQGIRAALSMNEEMVRLARRHNDANVLCAGSDYTSPELLNAMLDIFFNTEFEGGRHERRLSKIVEFEFSKL
ncbi:MAG: ribose 5-phosphate isomerase B [Puniceicoccales bacterium]|jgi:ribose 5-phosphate isomerase B|nr:ribose 5-phosphate isomerase B [Puniceicoccales bacterium]